MKNSFPLPEHLQAHEAMLVLGKKSKWTPITVLDGLVRDELSLSTKDPVAMLAFMWGTLLDGNGWRRAGALSFILLLSPASCGPSNG